MFRIIAGLKGSGKTKTLISMVNNSLEQTKGVVVCIEKGKVLTYDIKYQCRLVNSEEYSIDNADSLYGFVAGILACNTDVTDLYIDQSFAICNRDLNSFESLIERLAALSEKNSVNMVITASIDPNGASSAVKKFII